MTGQDCIPKSKTYTWTLKEEMNTSIKGKESEVKSGSPRRRKNQTKGEKEGYNAPRMLSEDLDPTALNNVALG